jgi:hypothetical protein
MSDPLLRRTYPRYRIHKIVSYSYGGKEFITLTLDLGLGGMKLSTYSSLPQDERLSFKLVLGVDSIGPRGRIAYSRFLSDNETFSGVQFIELSSGDLMLLDQYLASLEEWPKPRGLTRSGEKDGTEIRTFRTVEDQ